MNDPTTPDLWSTVPAHRDGPTLAELALHLDRLVEERELLGRELLRCHEQLNLVFDINEQISHLTDPDAILSALLRRFGSMLEVGAVFLDRAGCCMRIELDQYAGPRLDVPPEHVRGVLASHIEIVRETRQARVPPLTPEETARLAGAHVLLGTLQRADRDVGVVVALRAPAVRPFDGGDLLASASVLAYGTQVLRNLHTVRHLQRTALETVCTLVNAIDAKDNYTSTHSERVGGFARLVGEALGLAKPQLQSLEWAGLLHDVGKIGVPEQILNKPGALTQAEFELMKKHAVTGYEVLKPVAQLAPVLEAVLYHHENHDGSGYPQGLAGEEIPLAARIIHVVDIFDALTTNRPYRRSYGIEQAIQVLLAGAGRATDPELTEQFIETLRRYRSEQPGEFRARFSHLTETDNAAQKLPPGGVRFAPPSGNIH
ncbi:MAG: HD-GYP domain-containing protein [Phycisphaerae bacterium]|nr:HD-GYP domain-containing protein [Phycisphaerae bacterium]